MLDSTGSKLSVWSLPLENYSGGTRDGGKGKVALFRKLAMWGHGRQMSPRPSSPSR